MVFYACVYIRAKEEGGNEHFIDTYKKVAAMMACTGPPVTSISQIPIKRKPFDKGGYIWGQYWPVNSSRARTAVPSLSVTAGHER